MNKYLRCLATCLSVAVASIFVIAIAIILKLVELVIRGWHCLIRL